MNFPFGGLAIFQVRTVCCGTLISPPKKQWHIWYIGIDLGTLELSQTDWLNAARKMVRRQHKLKNLDPMIFSEMVNHLKQHLTIAWSWYKIKISRLKLCDDLWCQWRSQSNIYRSPFSTGGGITNFCHTGELLRDPRFHRPTNLPPSRKNRKITWTNQKGVQPEIDFHELELCGFAIGEISWKRFGRLTWHVNWRPAVGGIDVIFRSWGPKGSDFWRSDPTSFQATGTIHSHAPSMWGLYVYLPTWKFP